MTLMLDQVKVDPNAQHGREMHAALHVAAKAGESSAARPASAALKDWDIVKVVKASLASAESFIPA